MIDPTKCLAGAILATIAVMPGPAIAGQDGPACAVLRNADLGSMLPGDIGYNSATFKQGDLVISNCNAIGGGDTVVTLRMFSFAERPDMPADKLQDRLLDALHRDIPFLQGVSVTKNSVYYAAEGDLIFWSSDSGTMYVIDDAPDYRARATRAARMVARSLDLETAAPSEVIFE